MPIDLTSMNQTLIQPGVAFIAPYDLCDAPNPNTDFCDNWSISYTNNKIDPFNYAYADTYPIPGRIVRTNGTIAIASLLITNSVTNLVFLSWSATVWSFWTDNNSQFLKDTDDTIWFFKTKGICVSADQYFFDRMFADTPADSVADFTPYPDLLDLYNRRIVVNNPDITTGQLRPCNGFGSANIGTFQ